MSTSKFDKNYDTENVSLQLNSEIQVLMFCVILANINMQSYCQY